MSPLDIAVMFFFVLIAGRAVAMSFSFWKDQERLAYLEHELSHTNAKPAVSAANNKAVRVTRTQYRVYRRIDNRLSASSPASLPEDLHLRSEAGKQMTTAA
ncbi:MAG: hypothetical protein J6O00_06890 [Clostridiales bacterium]|nr:hypothetical protein [Clostridiales bacterium]